MVSIPETNFYKSRTWIVGYFGWKMECKEVVHLEKGKSGNYWNTPYFPQLTTSEVVHLEKVSQEITEGNFRTSWQFWRTILCCPDITDPLSLANIFFKIDERTKIFLWKGVKCFCSDVQNPSVTVPDDFGHLRPIFNFFVISKKALFRWYTFALRISIFESCEFYHYFGHVFYLQWIIILDILFK